jgi:hypothetical protein
MSKIVLLDSLLSQYKVWTLKLTNASKGIENNILQKDPSNKLEEKIVSIGLSSILVYIGSAVVALFGIATGGIGIVVLFIIGWLLSKLLNKKIFGSERKLENIRDDEQMLLDKLQVLEETHKTIRKKMNDKNGFVNFTNYAKLRREFNEAVNLLINYDTSSLALKYRYKHSYVTNKYKVEVSRFNEIYANKTRG